MKNLNRISAWVDDGTKSAFNQAAKENGTTESGLLKLLIDVFLKKNPTKKADGKQSFAAELKTDKVSIRLTPAEGELLSNLANKRGMKRSSYLAALFRTQLSQQPYFPESELLALREANQQLVAIGRNINQIAKVLNTSLDESDTAKAIEYRMMKDLIDKHRVSVKAFIRANLESWSVKDAS